MPKLKFESFIEKEASEQFMLGAFDNGKIIGIVGYERGERQRARHRGEVVQIYVDDSYHGQNIGEKLLPHRFRHTGAINYLQSGGNIFTLQSR